MDFTVIINDLTGPILGLAQANPRIALAVLLILAYLVYRKPVFFSSIFILGLILVVVLYLIIGISNPGVSEKEKMLKQERKPEISLRLPGILL